MMSSGTRINSTDSSIKIAIDTWYENNLKTDYGKYLSTTAIYCNDRTEKTAGTYNANGTNFDFAPRYRAYSSFSPTYDCTEASDAFSVDNEKAKLQYPVALMTSDEIMYAGGRVNSSNNDAWYVLNGKNSFITAENWFLLSPANPGLVFTVAGQPYGKLFSSDVLSQSLGIRLVLSLKNFVKYSNGDGTANNPYTIEETSSGC
jgi:hypothetical protein